MSRIQKGCLTAITIGIIFHLVRYFSPQVLVDWGADPFSPILATLFDNSNKFTIALFDLTVHPFFPLCLYIISAIFVINMYKIEDIISNRKSFIVSDDGVTLVEIMVVIGIISIMSMIAYPMFDTNKYRHRAAVSEFRGAMQLAKSEAVKSNRSVWLGVNGSHYDLYRGNTLFRSFDLPPAAVFNSTIDGGELGKQNVPTKVPDHINNACNAEGVPMQNCVALSNWLDSFSGKEYDHITEFTSRGFINSGTGTYDIIMSTGKGKRNIPVNLSMSGIIKVGYIIQL